MDRSRLLDRHGLREALAEFGISYQDRSLRALLKKVGVIPAETVGRQHMYDPLTVWTLACVYLTSKGVLSGLTDELDVYRRLVPDAQKAEYAEFIPGFVEDDEFAANLLLVCGPDFGIEPMSLIKLVREQPELLEYCRYGADFMRNALSSYKRTYAHWLQIEPLTIEWYHQPLTDDGLRRHLASTWIEMMGQTYAPAPDMSDYEDPDPDWCPTP